LTSKALERLKRKLTIEVLWLYIIAVLLGHGPTYPYDAGKLIERRFGFRPSKVTLYTVFYKLEREGLLEKRSDGTYDVTGSGVRAFRNAISLLESTTRTLRETAFGDQRD